MKLVTNLSMLGFFAASMGTLQAQKNAMGVSKLKIAEAGVAWYSTMDTAIAEAKRSNRPILFMSAACQAAKVTGIF